MLKGLTSTFKEGCNNVELTYSEYVKLDNQTIPVKATLKDDSYENGNFIGTFILKEIQFETEATYEFRNKEFEYYKVVDGESIKIGTFISTDITINDTTEIVKVVGMDYGLKTQVEYTSSLDYASGEITLKDVWDECCTLSGLESGISDFANSDFIVDSDQFTGTGAMIRDVFKGIAMSSGSFVKVMNDDKVYLVFNEFTSEKEELEIDGSASADDVLKIDSVNEIEGNTTQSGAPTPSSPQPINVVSGRQEVNVCGKNLLKLNDIAETTKNGITYSCSNGEIRLNGTATGGVLIDFESFYLPSGNYYLTRNLTGTTSGSWQNYLRNSSANIKQGEGTFTTNGENVFFRLYFNSGVVLNNVVFKPMINKGSSATTYEAYTGQSYEINLGKNLFNKDTLQQGGLDLGGSGIETDNPARIRSNFIEVQPNTSYVISHIDTIIDLCGIGLYKSDKSYDSLHKINKGAWNNFPYTFTTQSDTKYVRLAFRNSNDVNITPDLNYQIQLEKGNSASSFSPYKTPIELCEINDYKDRIYKDNGTWYLHKEIGKVVLNGSEDWSKNGNLQSGYLIASTSTSPFYNKVKTYGGYSNYFIVEDSFTTWTSPGKCGFNSGFTFWLYHTDTSLNTLQLFKTWLSTHNTIVYYVLATPTTEEITDSELINQLNSIELLEGLNNISITSNDLTGKLKLTYYNNEFDIIEDYVELEDKRDTHPWTCLRLGMSNIDGENVDYIDEDLVEQYGENWLILNDNPFAYNQEKRQQLITNIFNQIKAFGYSAFVSKVAFKPYLTSGDIIHFRNREKELVKSIVLRYTHSGEQITLEAPSETSATVNYIYPLNAIDIAKQTQIIVDKDSGRIDSLTSQTQTIQDDLRQNYYTLEQTNELVQTASTGLTNTFSEAGGNNIFRNTGLWFETTDNSNPYEFWNGVVAKQKEDRASNMNALLLQNGTLEQEQLVPNGIYTISFKYQKLVFASIISVSINDVVYELSATEETTFTQTIEISSQHINIKFITNVNNSCEVYDLMVNAGAVSLAYSQNQNETTTDTVNISKGIEITSSDTDVRFKANADGIRTLDKSGNVLTNFTDTGMKTKEAIIEDKAQITGTLWQEVNGQTWITRL